MALSSQDDEVSRPAKPPIVLTIAGFDPSSGAGITADLQVFAAHGLFGTSAITALTVQSTLGVASTYPVDPAILSQTLANLTVDLPPAGIKLGMLATVEIVSLVAHFLQSLLAENVSSIIPIVLDPVIAASSGASLLDSDGLEALHHSLLPRVTWITPNWRELALLAASQIHDIDDVQRAMLILGHRYPHLHIVATGGDQPDPSDLLRTPAGIFHFFSGKRIVTTSTHGTGCAFSSALLSRLVLGDSPLAAVAAAKSFVEDALLHAPGLGHGRGPLDLLGPLRRG